MPMSLELSLYTIESDLANLVEMREEAQERIAAIGNAWDAGADIHATNGLESAIQELAVIDDQIREYVTAEIHKVDNIRAFWRHCELMRDAAKEEAGTQLARSKAWGAQLDRLKETCRAVMETIPFPDKKPKKLEGRTGALLLKGNGGKQAVEVSNEALVPDELCTVTVTMPADTWALRIAGEFPGIGSWPNLKIGPRTPSLSLIGEALQRKCEACEGRGHPRDPVFEEHISPDTCGERGGSGHASVPGARLAERGSHVEVK